MAHMLYYCYIFALNRAVDSAERNGVDILDLTPVLSDLHTCKHEDFRAGFAPCMQPHFIKLSGLDGFNRIKVWFYHRFIPSQSWNLNQL
jgi:hypothetical protein